MVVRRARLRPWGRRGLTATACTLLLSCTQDAEFGIECGRLAHGRVVTLSWWSAGKDDEALRKVKSSGEGCNPDLTVDVSHTEPNKKDAVSAFEASVPTPCDEPPPVMGADAGPQPPRFDVFFTNIDTARTLACVENRLLPMSFRDNAGFEYLPGASPELTELIERIRCPAGGTINAIPLLMHQLNKLYYHKETLANLDKTADDLVNWEDFAGILETAKNSAAVKMPLVVDGGDYGWSQLVLENMLLALNGAVDYEAFWSGRLADGHGAPTEFPALSKTLTELRRIADTIVVAGEESALAAVERGDALFTVAGDWETPTDRVGVANFPGTGAFYLYTLDVAVIPCNAPNRDGAKALLRSIVYPAHNKAIARAKGARALWGPAEPLLGSAASAPPRLVPSVPVLVAPTLFRDLNGQVAQYARHANDDGDRIIKTIGEDYCELADAECEIPPTPQ